MCDQQSFTSAWLCSLEYSMNVKLQTEHHLEFLSLKRICTGWSESTLVKMPHCWKSQVTAQILFLSHQDFIRRSVQIDYNIMLTDIMNPKVVFISTAQLISAFVFTQHILFFSKSLSSSLWPSSVAVQPNLCQSSLENPKTILWLILMRCVLR